MTEGMEDISAGPAPPPGSPAGSTVDTGQVPEEKPEETEAAAATSTTTTLKTSSHVTRCSDSQKNYCVNGGECFTLEIMPGSTKFLCRCPNEFTGDRCQNYVMASFYKAEELYQKRILTIAGICIALLVVGIMCVVAYCKTKKQRKKLHDRLKQSLRNKRNSKASSSRGRQSANVPLQDLQLVNQCNGITMEQAADKDTETTFSTSKYALSAHEPTALTNISSQRYVSDVTSPATPGSPPSEMSAPLSSLAISVPSVALSPSGEEERPLLLSRRPHKSSARDEQKRTSAHYNHGHVAHSAPSSPLLAKEHGGRQTPGDRDADALAETLAHTNNNITDYGAKRVANGHALYGVESGGDVVLEGEAEEPQGEHTPFLTAESVTALLLRAVDGSRTNPASPNHHLQVQASSATATKHDPVAV